VLRKLAAYLRQNVIAVAALFVALGGTSYAALTINGSQIRNRSIDAVKLDPKTISASIRAWAVVYAGSNSASPGASSSRVRVRAIGSGEVITWPNTRFGRNCMPSVTPQVTVPTGPYGSVTTQFDPRHGSLTLYGFGPDKLGRPQAAYVMIVCP
jgi:hypothetical protein